MTDTTQLRGEVAHWRLAVRALADLDTVAAPAAWEALEHYVGRQVRSSLTGVIASLEGEAAALQAQVDTGHPADDVRRGLLRLRTRYLRAETLLDFYGDAINSRTNPALGALLRGYDTIASDSMATILSPLGIASPPVLTYVDKGLGASILRAGIRLWDRSHPSPVAAIKLTRHNLSFPTALLHETGHQVLALTGYNDELAARLVTALGPRSTEVAQLFASWASELGADVHAVHHAGWPPAYALANVVDGDTRSVLRIRPGDPHPPALVRTLFNVALVRAWFGPGPWDALARAWTERHDLRRAGALGELTAESLSALDTVVQVSSMTPMRCFRGASFGDVLDPRGASPERLRELEHRAGDTLLSSDYLKRREPVRVLALLSARGLVEPARAETHRRVLTDWVQGLGGSPVARPGTGAAA